jgi:hypothetical protein
MKAKHLGAVAIAASVLISAHCASAATIDFNLVGQPLPVLSYTQDGFTVANFTFANDVTAAFNIDPLGALVITSSHTTVITTALNQPFDVNSIDFAPYVPLGYSAFVDLHFWHPDGSVDFFQQFLPIGGFQTYSFNELNVSELDLDTCSNCGIGLVQFDNLNVTITPLPSTWLMMLTGLAGFGFIAYCRQKKNAALPLFATGLAGLGLIGWRRKRKAQAVA